MTRDRWAASPVTSSSTASCSPTAKEPVIKGVSIDVREGGCIALVGESGGGKSTTAKLIARFYDPLEGAVRVDGKDLRDVQLRSYRRQLGVVLQDPFLFSGTIADNIRFGRPDATDEDDRVGSAGDRRRPGRVTLRRRARPRRARGRRRPLSGRASADLDRPGAARRPAHPDPGRGDLEHRPTERDPDRAAPSTGCSRAGRRSSSRTGWRPSVAPTRSSCSSAAGSCSEVRRRSCSARRGRSAGWRRRSAGAPGQQVA